jgi:hypothetical protein
VGLGGAPTGDPFTASATYSGPGFAGHTQAPARHDSDVLAQFVSACHVRQADPLTTGLQRSTCSPVAPHWVASAVVHAFTVGQTQAALPLLVFSTQLSPGSPQAAEEASYQQPVAGGASWAQVTTCPPASQKLEVAGLQRVETHAQEAAEAEDVHCWCVGQGVVTGPVEQTPPAAVQVASSSPAQDVPGMHCPAVVWPGQASAAVPHFPSLPHPWSDGQFKSDEQGAPVVVTVHAASRARKTVEASKRIGAAEYQNRLHGRVDSGAGTWFPPAPCARPHAFSLSPPCSPPSRFHQPRPPSPVRSTFTIS